MKPTLKACLQKTFNYIFQKNTQIIFSVFVIASAGLLIYSNTFGVPFLFDDMTQIVLNPKIQSLQWPWQFLFNNRRPVLYASLAFNFHQCGHNVLGFHIFNISVHILTAISLFVLIYKTCRLEKIGENVRKDAALLAFGASLLWTCHPLHTQAVTYIIQRAESLMALFFILTLYFSVNYLTSRKILWLTAAGLTALLCGLTKEVALALPVVVLLYDRAFISNSFGKALKDNRWLYLTLSFTWAVMFYLYFTTRPEEIITAGFSLKGITPLQYAINQPRVILHYLQLALWPDPLIFDYQWPLIKNIQILLPSIIIIASFLIILSATYPHYPALSFLGLSFFVILSPSSSFIPLKDLIYEYRMYLALCCLTIIFVYLLKITADHFINPKSRKVFFTITVCILALLLGGVSYQRNKVYHSEEKLWRDVLSKEPDNVRIWNDLGSYLFSKGRNNEATECFFKSFALNPESAEIASNLAMALGAERKFEQAIFYAQRAIDLSPDFAVGYNNLGVLYSQMGRYQESIAYYEKTLMLGFVKPTVLKNLGIALANSGHPKEALNVLKDAQRLDPSSEDIRAAIKMISRKL